MTYLVLRTEAVTVTARTLVVLLAGCYAVTLFSYAEKPPVLDSNFPILMSMLLIAAALSASSPHGRSDGSEVVRGPEAGSSGLTLTDPGPVSR
jgi:hypothetical protein